MLHQTHLHPELWSDVIQKELKTRWETSWLNKSCDLRKKNPKPQTPKKPKPTNQPLTNHFHLFYKKKHDYDPFKWYDVQTTSTDTVNILEKVVTGLPS